jgi:CheY-like chemotaxis protein
MRILSSAHYSPNGRTDSFCMRLAMGGMELLKEPRSRSSVPVVMLTSPRRRDRSYRWPGGRADDYLPKPFNLRELVVHIKVILRLFGRGCAGPDRFTSGDITIDVAVREAWVDCNRSPHDHRVRLGLGPSPQCGMRSYSRIPHLGCTGKKARAAPITLGLVLSLGRCWLPSCRVVDRVHQRGSNTRFVGCFPLSNALMSLLSFSL